MSADLAYLDRRYADVLQKTERLKASLLVLLEMRHNKRVRQIEQDISATLVAEPQAKLLQVPVNSAGLIVARRLVYDEGAMIFTAAMYPAETFSYSTAYRLVDGATKKGR